MRAQHEQAQSVSAPAFKRVADAEDVAERLAHLFARKPQVGIVHPDPHERLLTRVRFGLCDLVCMVRKNQVFAAAMNVDLRTQVAQRHRGAFDVPAGPAGTPRTLPGGFARLGSLPKGKIARELLELVDFHPCPGDQFVEALMLQCAVVLFHPYPVEDVATRLVGVPFVDQALHDLDDLRHLFGGARIYRRPHDVEVIHVAEVIVDVATGKLRYRRSALCGAVDEPVVYIGEVLDVPNLEPLELQEPAQHVEDDVAHGVPDVTFGVRRHTADVNQHLVAHRRECLFSLRQCVGDSHGFLIRS